jgi:ribonuclease P protein component
VTSSRPPIRNPQASTTEARGFTFGRGSRLLRHADFQRVYETGRRQFSAHMTFFYLLGDAAPHRAHVGFTVGRVLGPAVQRNRIRRRMRDAVRHNLSVLDRSLAERKLSAEVVINPKKGALHAEIAQLRAEVVKGFAAIAAGQPGPAPAGENQRGRRK